MGASVLARGARGGGVVVAGQLVKLIVQLLGVLVLSRLLTPGDFGLVAMVMVFVSLGDLIRDFGMPLAALQARTLSQQQASNVFWVSSALGAATAIVVAALTPVLVLIYGEPQLAYIAPVMATGLLLSGVQAQVQVQLARSMRFIALTVTDLASLTAGLVLAVGAAAAGWGYWALVVQMLSTSLVLLVSRSVVTKWVPLRPRRGHGSGQLFRAGTEFGLAQALTFAANNVDTLVIGTRWGADMLGFYNRAFRLYILPRSGLLDPLTTVVVPTVNAELAAGRRRATDVLLPVQFALSALLTWVYVVSAATADWLIPLVLGAQWQPSVLMYQLLAIGGCFAAFGSVSYWTFILEQQSRQLLHLHLVTKPLAVVLILIAVPFGVDAVALAYSLGLMIAWPINLVWLSKTAGQDSWAFFRVGMRVVGAAGIAFLVSRWALGAVGSSNPWLMIAIGGAVGTVVYVGALAAVPGGRRQMLEAVSAARAVVGRRRR